MEVPSPVKEDVRARGASGYHPAAQEAKDGGRHDLRNGLPGLSAAGRAAVADDGHCTFHQHHLYRRRRQLPAQCPRARLRAQHHHYYCCCYCTLFLPKEARCVCRQAAGTSKRHRMNDMRFRASLIDDRLADAFCQENRIHRKA